MTLTARFTPAVLRVNISSESITARLAEQTVREYIDVYPYEGQYEITPSSETQELETQGMRMTGNLIINPIPTNYGLITWNGSFLTVS